MCDLDYVYVYLMFKCVMNYVNLMFTEISELEPTEILAESVIFFVKRYLEK